MSERANRRMGRATKACRISAGMTQEHLAKRLRMTRPNVANIESGRFGIMWATVARLDVIFGGKLLRAYRVTR